MLISYFVTEMKNHPGLHLFFVCFFIQIVASIAASDCVHFCLTLLIFLWNGLVNNNNNNNILSIFFACLAIIFLMAALVLNGNGKR